MSSRRPWALSRVNPGAFRPWSTPSHLDFTSRATQTTPLWRSAAYAGYLRPSRCGRSIPRPSQAFARDTCRAILAPLCAMNDADEQRDSTTGVIPCDTAIAASISATMSGAPIPQCKVRFTRSIYIWIVPLRFQEVTQRAPTPPTPSLDYILQLAPRLPLHQLPIMQFIRRKSMRRARAFGPEPISEVRRNRVNITPQSVRQKTRHAAGKQTLLQIMHHRIRIPTLALTQMQRGDDLRHRIDRQPQPQHLKPIPASPRLRASAFSPAPYAIPLTTPKNARQLIA